MMIRKFISIVLICIGLVSFTYPDIKTWYADKQSEQEIESFNQTYHIEQKDKENEENSQELSIKESQTSEQQEKSEDMINDALYQEVLNYNQQIYESGQNDFSDAWNYKQVPISLSHLMTDSFGYIEIPSMGEKLSLYLGATDTNMAKGAAVLGDTSIPIGGSNTNAVIAGHRGWKSQKFFKYIEKLKVGDAVYVTNPWGTMSYRVESIDIIKPTEGDAIKIQEGKDMITLLTCHPYRSHGKYRYLVYCIRDESLSKHGETQQVEQKYTPPETIKASDGIIYPSSEPDIDTETSIRKIGLVVIIIAIVYTIINRILYYRKRKKESKDERLPNLTSR